ncbi:hypothetical protein VB738_00490 [Cyanobium gracile UHCC 0139]|uniref:Glutamine amidotransferase type-2 domain-containing protein n=1 Tax=Cyanobium gracile UHCC 0139 TaxID=3110308 RepID=A0ABU5RP03_9CYAN|nr:hypothetical protein [Cyanobium gracile]MEA5389724.1 hypothetical protein [Cyanobium gracile UHCC 0139]
MLLPSLMRLSWCSAELLHGAGHGLLLAMVDSDGAALAVVNLLEHRSPGEVLRTLAPLGPIGLADGTVRSLPWVAVGDPTPWRVRLKAGGGLLFNLLALVLAWGCLLAFPADGAALVRALLISMATANGTLLLASRTDWQAIRSGRAACFHCGHFGFVTAADPLARGELLPPPAMDRFRAMGLEMETLGAPAGAGLVLVRDRKGRIGFVGHGRINGKRGHLTRSLERGLRRAGHRAVRTGRRTLPSGLIAAWHYGPGASGAAGDVASHWLQWSPPQRRRFWTRLQGRWVSDWQAVQHRVAHDGAFEAFTLFGTEAAINELGPWLAVALRCGTPATGPSSMIAGLMDLLICKGDWFASVRLASLRLLAEPATTPATDAFAPWATGFEAAFQDQIASCPDASLDHPEVLEELTLRIQQRLEADPRLRRYSSTRTQRWIRAAIGAFLHNDPFAAARQFMACARGRFGLVVISSTWPDRLVLCSQGQSITIGFDGPGAAALYASEPAAVDAVLAGRPGCHRIDLDPVAGEIAVLSSTDLTIHSLLQERELTAEEIRRRRQLSCEGPGSAGPASRLGRQHLDPVGADLAAIPGLLSRIQDDWIHPLSANRASAKAMAGFLIAMATRLSEKQASLAREGLDPALARSSHVDLLVTGIENNLWLGAHFARDLEGLMPMLNVRTLSASTVLQRLHRDASSLNLYRQSIVLVLSDSGQSTPCRQVLDACDRLVHEAVIQDVFLIIGDPASLPGARSLASGGADSSDQARSQRLFTTAAGRRTSEAATATVAAMHQTLTELLFCLCRQVQQACPDQRPLGLRLRAEALLALETMEDQLLVNDVRAIIGADEGGLPHPSAVSRRLVQEGRQWAWHVLETPTAWLIHAAYVLGSLGWGMPLFRSFTLALLPLAGLAEGHGLGALLLALTLPADVALYVLGPWCWTLGLRVLQGRQPLARTGRRTLVIGEAEGLHQLLSSYVSKLFALSYGLTALDVHGADPTDSLLHGYAHRLVRGTLLFLGVPDGRCSQRQRAHADAVIEAARQADGLRHLGTGPDIVALSSDPCIADGRFRAALVIPSPIHGGCGNGIRLPSDDGIEAIRESRFGSLRRLLAAYVFFHAMARRVAMFPGLGFDWWTSQSRPGLLPASPPMACAVGQARAESVAIEPPVRGRLVHQERH